MKIAIADIRAGATLPRGYGPAWVDVATHEIVAFPAPLNLVVRALRTAWRWVTRARVVTPASGEGWWAYNDGNSCLVIMPIEDGKKP